MDEEIKLCLAFDFQDFARIEGGEGENGPVFLAKGFAAVSNVDTDLIQITREALAGAIEDLREYKTVLFNHKRDCPVGSLWKDPELKRNDRGDWGIWVEARVSNSERGDPSGKQIQDWIMDKTIRHFSIQGDAKIEEVWSREHEAHIRRVQALKAHEISFVTVPGNVLADVFSFEIKRGETLGSLLSRELERGRVSMAKTPDLKDVKDINVQTAKEYALQIVGEEQDGKLARELGMLFDKIERADNSSAQDAIRKVIGLLTKAKRGKPGQLNSAVALSIAILSKAAGGSYPEPEKKRDQGDEELGEVDEMIRNLKEEFGLAEEVSNDVLTEIQKALKELPNQIADAIRRAPPCPEEEDEEEKKKKEKRAKKKEEEEEEYPEKDKKRAKKEEDEEEEYPEKDKKRAKKKKEDEEEYPEPDKKRAVEPKEFARAMQRLSDELAEFNKNVQGLPIRRGLDGGPNDDDLEIKDEDDPKTAVRKAKKKLVRSKAFQEADPAERLSRLIDLKVGIEGDRFDVDENEEESVEKDE